MNEPTAIFDRALLAKRKTRNALRFAGHDFLYEESALRLCDRLEDVTRSFENALEIGCQGNWLAANCPPQKVKRLTQAGSIQALLPEGGVLCTEENLPFETGQFDLVLSNLALHWVNDLPAALMQAARVLKPDGLFLAALPGGRTLEQLRTALDEAAIEAGEGLTPRISPFVEVRDAGSLLQRAGFALPVVDSECLNVTYPNIEKLFADLRGAGEANVLHQRSRVPLKRSVLARAAEIYHERFRDGEDRLEATFELVTLTAWKPHESQQQPAQRGSGQVSLADVLDFKK